MSNTNQNQQTLKQARQEIVDQVRLRLGGGIVDIELDNEHLDHALDTALERYRQRSANAVEESYSFLELQPEQTTYTLPDEIIEVRKIYRRGVGGQATGGGTYLDPFALAYTNLYLLQSGRQGGLATFDFFHQYQHMVGRMFGEWINFKWDPRTHTMEIMRRILSPETVLLWHHNYVPDEMLLRDTYARPWLRDYTLAQSKIMLGEARSKFAQIAGPQGGTTLNGDALKAEGNEMLDKLEEEIKNYVDGSQEGLWFVVG
jgi:hypothetical protein